MNKSRNLKALLSMVPLKAYGTIKSVATVYWIEDGKVYYSISSCRTSSRSKNIKSSTLDKVLSRRRACEVCYTNIISQKSSNTTK